MFQGQRCHIKRKKKILLGKQSFYMIRKKLHHKNSPKWKKDCILFYFYVERKLHKDTHFVSEEFALYSYYDLLVKSAESRF